MVFQYLKGAFKREGEDFVQVDNDRTRYSAFKLKEIGFSLAVKRNFLFRGW